MCLLLLSVHAAFTVTDYRQKYCTAWTDRHLHSGLTNGFFFFFYSRKEQNAADSSGSGSCSRLCASAPASRASARPRTCCVQSPAGPPKQVRKHSLTELFTTEFYSRNSEQHEGFPSQVPQDRL